jgi:hypothetical protein
MPVTANLITAPRLTHSPSCGDLGTDGLGHGEPQRTRLERGLRSGRLARHARTGPRWWAAGWCIRWSASRSATPSCEGGCAQGGVGQCEELGGLSVERFYEALKAEGCYEVDRPRSTCPLNLLPLFCESGPLFCELQRKFKYSRGDLPRVEAVHRNTLKLRSGTARRIFC